MNLFKKILILTIFIPIFSVNAAGSAQFSGTPQATFASVGNGYQPTLSGQISVQDATEDDFFLGVKVFQSASPLTQEQIDSSDSLTFLPTIASGTGYFFNASSDYALNPGTSYYFVFKIIPNDGSGITGDVEVINVFTPGAAGEGNTTNPDCTDCPVSPTPQEETGSFAGWPSDVIDNPLEVEDLNNFIANVLNAFLKIAIPILAVFLIYSGLKFVMARGNEKELETAKQNLLWTVIGGAILLGAWTIVRILKGTVDQLDITIINSLINYFV